MRLAFFGKDGPAPSTFFGGLVLFACVYYNLTPFVGVDCWWHMRFAEYFLEHGTPVLFDPFAVQGERILATYPDLLPGLLMLGAYKAGAILGMNILRILIFSSFLMTLLLLVRKAWSGYTVLLQTAILTLSMAGRVILQPDLFNYILFALWIYLLDGIIFERTRTTLRLVGILLLEQLWVNTHPLFFYYGLGTAIVYFGWALAAGWRNWDGAAESTLPRRKLCICLVAIGLFWLINPLGWRALESLFVNMIDKGVSPFSMMSPLAFLDSINVYGYLAVVLLFLLEKPWRRGFSRLEGCVAITMAAICCAPAIQYERSLPYMAIYLILLQRRHYSPAFAPMAHLRSALMVCTVLASLLLIVGRGFPQAVSGISAAVGFKMMGSPLSGLGVADIAREEPLREIMILNRIATPGNCVSNMLEIASSAVWFSPDKPFYIYGHAAVINARWKEMVAFLSHVDSEDADRFAEKNDIRTLILRNDSDRYLSVCLAFREHWQLVYLDPLFAILVRKDTLTDEQNRRIAEFYSSYRPGLWDAQRFTTNERIYQYFLLWFGAEVTGNDGSYYLSVAEHYIDPGKLHATRNKLHDLMAVLRVPDAPGGPSAIYESPAGRDGASFQ